MRVETIVIGILNCCHGVFSNILNKVGEIAELNFKELHLKGHFSIEYLHFFLNIKSFKAFLPDHIFKDVLNRGPLSVESLSEVLDIFFYGEHADIILAPENAEHLLKVFVVFLAFCPHEVDVVLLMAL